MCLHMSHTHEATCALIGPTEPFTMLCCCLFISWTTFRMFPCWRSPRPPPHSTQRLVYSQLWFITVRRDIARSGREKARGAKSKGKQAWASKSPLPEEPHRTCVSEILSTREAHSRLSNQGFYWGLVTLVTLFLVWSKMLDSQKKTECLTQTILLSQTV